MDVDWQNISSVMIDGVWIGIDPDRGYAETPITYVLDGSKHLCETRCFGFYTPDGTFLHGPVTAISCYQSYDRG
jgi:hypothetical protein